MTAIIAIDGPAAAGKGTLARRLAAQLGLPYLDTGLLYRAVGARLRQDGADPANPALAQAAAQALRPEDLARADLRGPAADRAAAQVAAIPGVRAALLDFQRRFGAERGAVLDGRDIGTVIFPDAPVKLFVTASLAARAQRRWRELQGAAGAAKPDAPHLAPHPAPDLAAVTRDMAARDAADAARAVAPLRPAADAVLLDTTALDPDAAFTQALAIITEKLGSKRLGIATPYRP